jgi:hypothetical protein
LGDFYCSPDTSQRADGAEQQAPAPETVTVVKYGANRTADKAADGYAKEYDALHVYQLSTKPLMPLSVS